MEPYRFALALLTPFVLVISASGQTTVTDKRVLELLKHAEKAEREGSTAFVHAETLYEEALALAPDHPEVNLRMGLCQLNGPQRHKALPYFEKAASIQADLPRVQFLLGYALQLNARWDEAIAAFELYKQQAPYPDPDPLYNTADKHLSECRNGRALMAAPVNVRVENMGPGINSPQADYGAVMSADASMLLFTSRRPVGAQDKVNKVTGDHFEDVYASHLDGSGWTAAERLPAPVNTPGNDASVGMFNDGRTLLLYRDEKGPGDLFESTCVGGQWNEPVQLGANVNTVAHESSAWYSFDRQWLYFVSERPDDNVGGQDIYRSHWDPALGDWGPPEDLGPQVNSIHDEEGIMVHPDGRTIYFSSKGHNSMGGFDVFRSRYEDGHWTKAENLGWPINSPDDDLFFMLSADGRHGYFSSFRADGQGEDDLYAVAFLPDPAAVGEATANAAGAVAPLEKGPSAALVKGRITTLEGHKGLDADIELVDLADASLVARFKSDAMTGEYLVAVPAGRSYAMYVKANGHLLRSEHVGTVGGEQGTRIDMVLMPMEAGRSAAMKNLFFATGSAEMQPASLAELGQLKDLLTSQPSLRLQISGHADGDGGQAADRTLGEARANAVRDHLIGQGVAADRLTATGHVEEAPVDGARDAGVKEDACVEITVL